jgi:cysteine-rich repeat protein
VFVASFAGSVANVFDHNLYASDAGSGSGEFTLNGAEFTGLAAWQSGTAQDGASLGADPSLGDPEAGDFHIDAASPAFDAGDPAYVPAAGEKDLDGAARVSGTRVDIGADEASCGDGVVDPGEQCDDGDQTSGDGCDANCTTTACGNGVVTAGTGEQCDDGNTVGGDCCGAGCTFEPSGAPCADSSVCTLDDACNGAGACTGDPEPDATCVEPSVSRASTLKITERGADDRLTWKWGKASVGAFDDPTAGEAYTLCVYVNDGGVPALLVEALAEPGAKWDDQGDGRYQYRDSSLLPDGIARPSFAPASTSGRRSP